LELDANTSQARRVRRKEKPLYAVATKNDHRENKMQRLPERGQNRRAQGTTAEKVRLGLFQPSVRRPRKIVQSSYIPFYWKTGTVPWKTIFFSDTSTLF
jgi:hypothetical protein